MRISDWSSDVCSSDLWRQNRIAGVAPQVDASLDHVELQRRNMALIVAIPTATILQCPRLVYVHPDRRRIPLPHLDLIPVPPIRRCGAFLWIGTVSLAVPFVKAPADRLCIFSRLAECDIVVSQSLAADLAILYNLLVQEPD